MSEAKMIRFAGFLAGVILISCGPDRVLLSETRLDPALKVRIEDLEVHEQTAELVVEGKCSGVINGPMRSALVSAGANISTMKGDTFKARIPSGDLYDVAGLDFVSYLKLLDE
jgi:hypothetical protein